MATGSNSAVIARVAAALYDVQLGNASMSWALDQVDRVHGGNVGALIQGVIANDAALKALTPAQMATLIVKNVGITGAGVAATESIVASELTAALAPNGAGLGATIVALLNNYAGLTADATYGTAAKAFNSQIFSADTYSQTIGTVDRIVHPPLTAAQIFNLASSTALGKDVMNLTGGMDVRIDFTNSANQIRGLDLDGDGLIETNGIENVSTNFPAEDRGANFEIVDAYPRNPLNHTDAVNNFLGDIAFDGTGFAGDGVSTNGNVFLGGLGVDVAFGGNGNDFLAAGAIAQGRTGVEVLRGGRNADFFFAQFSGIDATDGNGAGGTNTLFIDGGNTSDSTSAGTHGAQDSDWLLIEASDDDEPVRIVLDETAGTAVNDGDAGRVTSRSGETLDADDVENFDASGNLYGFLNGMNVEIGERASDDRDASAATVGYNYGYGASAQLDITGSAVANIIVAGYDNDIVRGEGGSDILFGGNLKFLNNPNLVGIVNDGRDEISGGDGNDSIVFEADGGAINGDGGTDTLFVTNYALGTKTAADLTSDGFLRFDMEASSGASNGYGGANTSSQDRTNYKGGIVGGRVTMATMDSVIATGMGAIDYKAAGANTPELLFTNQQNQLGYAGNLDLRGNANANTLYANTGTDVLEGRRGDDALSGGDGNDDFYFAIDGDASSDNVDVIHRQSETAVGSNLHNGSFERDFNIGGATTVGASSLTVDLGTTNLASADVAMTSFTIKIGGVTFAVTDTTALAAANSAAEVAALVNTAYKALDAKVTAVAVGNTIVVTDTGGRDISDTVAEGYFVGGVVSNGAFSALATFAPAGSSTTADRLIYKSYEDRSDNEGVDDDSVLGSTISLGSDGYAEDLVIWFGDEDGDGMASTRIAEDQSYVLEFTNLTTQDRVTVSVNGVNYTLQVGVDLDGNIIAGEDGVGDTQAAIQTAFVARLATFINTFMDDDTVAGAVDAVAAVGAVNLTAADSVDRITLTQRDYNGEDTVFMVRPTITIQNLSGGQSAASLVTNVSQHELELLDFDGRNGELHEMNVLFVGQEFVSRAELSTAKNAGGTQTGNEAMVIDVGANNLQDVIFGTTTAISNNTATNGPLSTIANGWAVHGDDFLLGGNGIDTINGGTGDDRVEGSTAADVLDGGKNFYAVQVLGEPQARVYVLNHWESQNPSKVTALQGLTLSSITLIDQNESGTGVISGRFDDTLQFSQNNFSAGNTRFTVTLNDFVVTGGVVELRNDGAGTVGVDVEGDGVIEHTSKFTNFENIRTVSGRGNAVAGDGQGNDTLDVTLLSSTTTGAGGISYDLTNTANAGKVKYSTNAILTTPVGADFPVAADYETDVIRVDGVESVLASTGADLLTIDETEAAKNNTFSAGLGVDRIDYVNQFTGGVGTVAEGVAQPTVAIKLDNVAASVGGTDTVTMTAGRVGTTVATDTLNGVEYIGFDLVNGTTAGGSREDDLLDVTAMTAGAVISYVDGSVKDLNGVTHVVIQGIQEIENIWADGNDTVIVADSDLMNSNNREDVGDATAAKDIFLATFMDFDTVTGAGARKAFAAQTTGEIEDATNQQWFKWNLSKTGGGNDTDTVDYSNIDDDIAVVVELDASKPNQYVLVDGDPGINAHVGDAAESNDRIDTLISVERIVAAQGTSILDLTGSTKGLEIKWGAFDVANQVASLDRDVYSVRISDLSTASPLQRTFLEYRDAGLSATVAQPTATWSRVEGSDNAEVLILNSAHSLDTNTFNLRGGANQVKYNELTKSITLTLSVTNFDADATAFTTGFVQGVVTFQDGTGAGVESGTFLGGQHTITSYTANNEVATGSLRIAASQDAEDTLKISGLDEKVFLVAEVGTVDNQITVKLGSGSASNSVVLTGFELVADSGSNDVYDFGSLVNAGSGLNFVDNAADHDTVKVGNDAVGFDGTDALGGGAVMAGATEISLGAIRDNGALAVAGFDFDVLDITKVTDTTVTTVTGALASGEFNTDEVIFGKINNITSAVGFEAVVLTNATVTENGTTYTLNTTTNTLVAGAKNVTVSAGTALSFGGTVLEQLASPDHLRAATDLNVTSGVTVNVVGNNNVNITGGNGNDTISAQGGADTLRGGSGNDTLAGGFTAAVGEIAALTLGGGAAVLAAAETLTLTGNVGTLVISASGGAGEIATASATADADQIGALLMAQTNAFLETELGYAAGSIASKSYDAASNIFTLNFTVAAGDVTDLTAAVSAGTMTAVPVITPGAAAVEAQDTYVFEATAALNGADTINGFNNAAAATDDQLDFTAFLGGASTFGAATNFVTTGLNLTVNNTGVVFNKATLAAADIATAAAAGKIAVADNGKAVVLVTGDANGATDGTNDGYKVYFIEDTDAGAGQTWVVTLVGTINSNTELNAADLVDGTDGFV